MRPVIYLHIFSNNKLLRFYFDKFYNEHKSLVTKKSFAQKAIFFLFEKHLFVIPDEYNCMGLQWDYLIIEAGCVIPDSVLSRERYLKRSYFRQNIGEVGNETINRKSY